MSYHGKVQPGGPAETRELADLMITKVSVDPEMHNNCYLLRCRHTDEQLLIDAASSPETLLPLVGSAGLATVVTTHQHWDHHRALAAVVEATGASTVAGTPDAADITEQTDVPIVQSVWDGDTITVGRSTLQVIGIVGHTPGSICLVYDDPSGTPHLFTGDTLFPGGVGATFGDTEAFRSLFADVKAKLFGTLPDETWFYPGHGNDGTLGAERPNLGEWEARGW